MSSGRELIFIYGPPGSGKSAVGVEISKRLSLPFWDLDNEVEAQARLSIPEIFSQKGESEFRRWEREILRELTRKESGVIALGGGALLLAESRALVEDAGRVICMDAPFPVLIERLQNAGDSRPLLEGEITTRLQGLLSERRTHYASFLLKLDATPPVEKIACEAERLLGMFRVAGMGTAYDVRVRSGVLADIGVMLSRRGLNGPVVVVSDTNVAAIYAERVLASLESAGYVSSLVMMQAGEANKNMQAIGELWGKFLSAKIERTSTVLALGGGVVGDTAGFAAGTYLRGVPWVAVPTTLLAMADASLGGKTGVDLPQGKNLVGAFHAPRMVISDPSTLATLPEAELRSGMAEVVKSGVIGDPELFSLCEGGWSAVHRSLEELVRRAMAVKIAIIQDDPFEGGIRASLNLGHTVGHAVELASGFRLRHGEAVAIGMVVEARLAESLGIAEKGLALKIAQVLDRLGLPVEIPHELDRSAFVAAMRLDKKRHSGSLRFALSERIGKVQIGVEVDPNLVTSSDILQQ